MIERFPVYWSPEPKQILDCEDRVKSEEYVLDFLISAMSSSESLSISSILKLEGDREAIEEYLGEKASTLTTANLKAFVSKTKKKEKEGLSTNVRESDIVFDCSTADGSLKRKRGDGSLRALDLTGVKEDARAFTAEEICSAHESQVMLHGYRDGPERSLWSTGYPFMVVSDEFAQVDSDVKIIHEAGKTGVARYLQVIGARLMSIGRTSELDSILEGDNVAAIKKLKASLQEKDEKVLKLRNELKATREIKRGRY